MPEGFHSNAILDDHPILRGLDWNGQDFLFLGYNELRLKEDATLLVEFDGAPIFAVREHGKGRTMAFAPDPGPHWSGNFHLWDGYKTFWSRAAKWLLRHPEIES